MTALWSDHRDPSDLGKGNGHSYGDAGDGFGCGFHVGSGCSDGGGDNGDGNVGDIRYRFGSGYGEIGNQLGDGYGGRYGYPEQEVAGSHVAMGRIQVEHPTLPVVELTTLAVTS